MTELIKTIILGLVQGLTEFLPISSSGHLVLFCSWLSITEEVLFTSVMMHFGTLLAVCWCMRKDLKRIVVEKDISLICKLLVASLPAAVVMLLFHNQLEQMFTSGTTLCFGFFTTAVILLTTDYFAKHSPNKPLTYKTAFIMGIGQAFATLPGISRSGSTIGGGVISGADRTNVAVFSFYMSVIVIFGSTVFELGSVTLANVNILATLCGMAAAFFSGIFAIKFLLKILSSGKLRYFSYYLFLLSIITFVNYFICPLW